MSFFLLRWGSGYGCDYTIACNKDITELKATTAEEAVTAAKKFVMPDEPAYYYTKPRSDPWYLDKAVVVELVDEIDMESIYDECRSLTAAREDREKEAKERVELERLKKKFE